MDFSLTEEHIMIRDAAKDFAKLELKPGVIQRDSQGIYPKEEVKKLQELGFMNMLIDTKYGGSGLDKMSYALAIEEISKVDNSCSVIMAAHNSLVCWGIQKYASEELRENFLRRLAGVEIGAFCLSEPEAGSDATQQKTTAIDKGDYYLLNGTKNWITNAHSASIYVVIAQTNAEKGHKGINAFIIDADLEGISRGPKEDKLGIRSSDTSSIMFQDVKVPKQNRIGAEGFGFKYAMTVIGASRIGIAAQALGIAQGSYELALTYSKERKTFGKPISNHQAIAFKLAKMATEIDAARMLIYKSVWQMNNNLSYALSSSMAKYYASEVAMQTTIEAVQIHGGYGFVKEYHVERLMRDAKITQIYEGTSEIQQIVISREILKD